MKLQFNARMKKLAINLGFVFLEDCVLKDLIYEKGFSSTYIHVVDMNVFKVRTIMRASG